MEKSERNLGSTDTHTATSVTFSGIKKNQVFSCSHFKEFQSSPTLIPDYQCGASGEKRK